MANLCENECIQHEVSQGTMRETSSPGSNHHPRRRRKQPFKHESVHSNAFRDSSSSLRQPRSRDSSSSLMAISCFIVFNGLILLFFFHLWWSEKLVLPKIFSTKKKGHFPSRVDRVWRTRTNDQPIILVVGLPKAGTSSLFEFFHCHGVFSQHWYCCGRQDSADRPGQTTGPNGPSYMSHCLLENLQSTTTENILDGCGGYDAYTEINGPRLPLRNGKEQAKGIFLPQHYHLQELHDAAPNATWILNIRDVNDWIKSVMNVPAHRLTEQFLEEISMNANTQPKEYNFTTFDAKSGSIRAGGKRARDGQFLKRFWNEHINKITSFVNDHPTHKLIVVNITDPDAGVELSKSLGWDTTFSPIPKAKACWKQYNVGDYGR